MAGLVEEIQRDALNSAVPVTSTLRKVKAAAAKLDLGKVEDWVEHELNGFSVGDVPQYRKLHGRPRAFNPYQGWIPIILESDEMNNSLASVHLKQSLPSVEDLISKCTAGFAEMPLASSVIRALNRGAEVELGRMSVHISTTQLQGVVDAVRNAILDWSLALEKAGIAGEGFSFDPTEKTRAQSGSVIYNISSIGSFTGVLGAGNTTGDIIVTQNELSQVANIAKQIRSAVPELERAGADSRALEKALDALELERSKQTPDRSRLAAFLSDARQAMVGAAGNLTAEGALSLIAVALKALS